MATRVQSNSPQLTIVNPVQETLVRYVEKEFVHVGQTQPTVQRLTQIYGQIPQAADQLGSRFYQDSFYTPENPLYVPAGIKTQIPDNGQGMLSRYYGVNSDKWLNVSTGRFYPDHLGDTFFYRANFTIMPTLNNKSILVSFEIGTANPVYNERESITSGAGVATPVSKLIMSQSGPGVVSNGGAIYVTSEMDCYVSKISVLVTKVYAANPNL